MDNKFSRSWINMRIHYDNMARSGILTEFIDKNDLKQYSSKFRDPIGVNYRGYSVYTQGPPSGEE